MLDKWFKEDINELFQNSNKVVLIDLDKNYDFLVDTIRSESDIKVFKVDDYLSDLEVKYKVEKEYSDSKVLIHTYLKTDDKNKQYMIQEYVATGREFSRPLNRYISEKSGLKNSEVSLTEEELILAGKMSLKSENNNKQFWNNIKIQGREAILGEFEDIVLRFLAEPENYVKSLPEGGTKHLYSLIGEYLRFSPEDGTDPIVVSSEFADIIFLNIINGNKATDNIYKNWLDSHKYRKKLKNYLSEFNLPSGMDIWKVNPDHPFSQIDEMWLDELSDLVLNNKEIPDFIIRSIRERKNKKEGMEITKSYYWKPISQILNFKAKKPHNIEDLSEYIEFYKNTLYKLDQSYRYINQHLLDREKAKKAFSILYKEKMKPYLDRWFELFGNYRENQSDYLYREIFSEDERKAVIIGDAISYEVSQEILNKFKNEKFNTTNKIINGNYPTTTVNNMSALFGSPYYNSRSKRESYLQDKLDNDLQVLNLDNVSEDNINPSKPAVIYGQDIDALSEKGHETALKYYNTFIDTVADKINTLLEAGYVEVHLVTDHGFVCNFNIDEADKYNPPVKDGKVRDRYILSNQYKEDKTDSFVVRERSNGEHNYIYYPKGTDPVKSKQQYGFAHGGITPQEILLPHLIFKKESSSKLKVFIENKEQLKNIGAQSFAVKLKSEEDADLFKTPRDIILKIEDSENTVISKEFTIDPSEKIKKSFSVDLNRYNILVLDAVSKEIIDSVKGKKENLRGGLDGFDIN